MKSKLFMLILSFFTIGCLEAEDGNSNKFPLVVDGNAKAKIIVNPGADTTQLFAARELQLALLQITGTTLFIGNEPANEPSIFIGTPDKVFKGSLSPKFKVFADDLKKIKGTDGFIVKNEGKDLFIIGECSRGVLNGVYSFLEKNTDIIWARPGEGGTVFTPRKDLTASEINYSERPVFKYRSWWICGYKAYNHYPTLLWMARNRINFCKINIPDMKERAGMYKELGIITALGGHNLDFWFPNSVYFKKNPDFYAIIDGVRRPIDANTTLCFTNKELEKELVKNISELVEKGTPPEFIGVNLMDNHSGCECPECVKPIKLPDGSIIAENMENFRSTQFFQFLNSVAKDIKTKYPAVKLNTFSYFLTSAPPAMKLEDNILIVFAPAVRCDKHTLLEKENADWEKKIELWKQRTSNLILYEYYGDGALFPRPLAETVANDLKYLKSCNFSGVAAELLPDTSYGWGDLPHSRFWDASAMQFWMISKLYWDFDRNVEDLQTQYLVRVFGSAAAPMGKFYFLIRNAWYKSPDRESFMALPVSLASKYIKTVGNEETCRGALEEAYKLANTRNRKELISQIRKMFEGWMAEIKPPMQVDVTRTDKDISQILDFKDPSWAKAKIIDGLTPVDIKTQETNKTKIRLMHDGRYLYVGVECSDNNANGINRFEKYKDMGREVFPGREDRIEIFLEEMNGSSYFQFVFGVSGTKYDGKGFDNSWNGKWSVITKTGTDGWSAVVVIPFETIGVTLNKDKAVRGFFYREYHPEGKDKQSCSWGGGQVHSKAAFGEMVLEK